jgi:hypothetical protein
MDQAVAFLTCVREVFDLNLGRGIDYPEGGFWGFPQSL